MQLLRRAYIVVAPAAVVRIAAGLLSAQTANPLAGGWRINLAKSKHSPANAALKSSTSRFEVTKDEVDRRLHVRERRHAERKGAHHDQSRNLA